MSFDYQTLDLNALISDPIRHDDDTLRRCAAMKLALLQMVDEGKIKFVLANGKKYKIEVVE